MTKDAQEVHIFISRSPLRLKCDEFCIASLLLLGLALLVQNVEVRSQEGVSCKHFFQMHHS